MTIDTTGTETALAPDLLAEVGRPAVLMENYRNTPQGNADRYWAMHAGEVLLHQGAGRGGTFYSSRGDGRWARNEGATAGDEFRRARDVVAEMYRRAGTLMAEGKRTEDEALQSRAKALFKWADKSDASFHAMDMVRSACLSYNAVVDPDEAFDMDTALLGLPDTLLELGEGCVFQREIRPNDRVTYSTGVGYDPGILDKSREPALIREFLDTFIGTGKEGAERARLIFKALGTALLGGNSYRLLIILQGKSGTNGKTQLVEALRAALGDYAGIGTPSIFRGNLEDKPRPDVISLLKKRVAFLAEASKAWELHSDRVKAITGGDGVKLRRMRTDDFLEVIPQFTPVIYTNEMPRVHGADRALQRRMLVIDFERQPLVEDPSIKQRFLASEEVRTWLLAALVRGYLEASADGVADIKEAFAALSEKAFNEVSHLGEFFEWLDGTDQLQFVPDTPEGRSWGIKSRYMGVKEFHERYQYWCKAHGNIQDKKDILNYREFNSQLRDTRGWVSIKNAGMRWEGYLLSSALSVMVPQG